MRHNHQEGLILSQLYDENWLYNQKDRLESIRYTVAHGIKTKDPNYSHVLLLIFSPELLVAVKNHD